MTTYMTVKNPHPSFGHHTREQVQEMINAPFRWKPDFESSEEVSLKPFKVTVSRTCYVPINEEAEVDVKAKDKDAARELVNDMEWDAFEWTETDEECADFGNFRIDSIVESN